MAIDRGLWYLHKTMGRSAVASLPVGSWSEYGSSGNATSGYYSVTAANVNAFLVNGHQQGCLRRLMQRGHECLHLGGRLDVAPRERFVAHILIEQDRRAEVARAEVLNDRVAVADFEAAKAGQHHLADLVLERGI